MRRDYTVVVKILVHLLNIEIQYIERPNVERLNVENNVKYYQRRKPNIEFERRKGQRRKIFLISICMYIKDIIIIA